MAGELVNESAPGPVSAWEYESIVSVNPKTTVIILLKL